MSVKKGEKCINEPTVQASVWGDGKGETGDFLRVRALESSSAQLTLLPCWETREKAEASQTGAP